jgi:hypothetical protein
MVGVDLKLPEADTAQDNEDDGYNRTDNNRATPSTARDAL